MPRSKLLDDPAVADLVNKREARAQSLTLANAVRAARAVTKEHLESLGDKVHIALVKQHGKAVLDAIRGGNLPTE